MFKKTLTSTIAALTIVSGSALTTHSAQAGSFGRVVAAAAVGAVVGGAIASARPVHAYEPYQRVYGYGGCVYRKRPVFDAYGNHIGFQRVSTC